MRTRAVSARRPPRRRGSEHVYARRRVRRDVPCSAPRSNRTSPRTKQGALARAFVPRRRRRADLVRNGARRDRGDARGNARHDAPARAVSGGRAAEPTSLGWSRSKRLYELRVSFNAYAHLRTGARRAYRPTDRLGGRSDCRTDPRRIAVVRHTVLAARLEGRVSCRRRTTRRSDQPANAGRSRGTRGSSAPTTR